MAELLKIPDWRVKNFSEGSAYGIPPSQTVGTGRGSRRLYREADVCRIAIANELVTCGFSPEAVGAAVREIPESRLTESYMDADPDEDPEIAWAESQHFLVSEGGKWKMRNADDAGDMVQGQFQNPHAEHGIFILNLAGVLMGLVEILRGEMVLGAGEKVMDLYRRAAQRREKGGRQP